MKRNLLSVVLVACLGLLSGAVAAFAHHSFAAQFDDKKPITLKGHVTKVEWTNPHTYFYLDVKDERGNVTNWAVEGGAPNILYRNGWKPTSLKVGDEIIVIGRLARDGSKLANGISFMLPDGRCLFAGSSGPSGAATTNCRQTNQQ